MSDQITPQKLSWIARIFRKKIKLTYWLNDNAYSLLVCDFKNPKPENVIYKDYYTKKITVIKSDKPINYVLEEL